MYINVDSFSDFCPKITHTTPTYCIELGTELEIMYDIIINNQPSKCIPLTEQIQWCCVIDTEFLTIYRFDNMVDFSETLGRVFKSNA